MQICEHMRIRTAKVGVENEVKEQRAVLPSIEADRQTLLAACSTPHQHFSPEEGAELLLEKKGRGGTSMCRKPGR
jgi:hypothetical protein